MFSKNGDDSNSQGELNAGVNLDNNAQTNQSLKSPSFEKIYESKFPKDTSWYNGVGNSNYYNYNDMYGVFSCENGFDTGNIYTDLSISRKSFVKFGHTKVWEDVPYYIVSIDKKSEGIEALHNYGLLDANGNEIIPLKYARIDVLSERYANVYELVHPTETISNGAKYLEIKETTYRTNVHTVDLTTGEILWTNKQDCEGNGFVNGIKGDYFTFDSTDHCEKANGVCLPDDATIFVNGSYEYDGAVYDTNDKKLFTYDENDYVPVETIENYYVASKTEGDNVTYIILDESGRRVSTVLPGIPSIYGDLLVVEGQVYDFDGNKVIEGTYDSVFYDSNVDWYWVLQKLSYDNNDKAIVTNTYIDRHGNIICKFDTSSGSDILIAGYYPFVICNLAEEKVYCFEDNDFTISATPFETIYDVTLVTANWFGVKSENKTINVFTGDVIIEDEVDYCHFDSDGNMYLLAVDDGMIRAYKQKS